ncbi:MAG TPA: PAS domain S-box protein [Candidatus Angelobacter sp.]|nr:PAS domain S-box protein [Candidatus Angelobacter sp.]
MEETHFTIAYSPVPDDTAPRGIGGVLATVHEISEKVVGERRTRALRDLGAGALDKRSAQEACARAAEILDSYPRDIAFSLIYLLDPDQQAAHLVCSSGLPSEAPTSPRSISLDPAESAAWPFRNVIATGQTQLVEDLGSRLAVVPRGPWSDPPHQAAVVPIHAHLGHQLAGFLVAGLSPRLRYDDSYRGFLDLVSSQIAAMIANARAYEEEKKRAEALAEIDRAKTAFFTNISHEFRTPLTLMLGPLEDLMAKGPERLAAEETQQVEVARRNALRLLKLVNTLLDFSRIEAGRVQAVYQPTDLSRLTAEVASSFRSAMEKAGLRFVLECERLDEPVYVDRDMWEKIILNLLSNAFKFTFAGEVVLSLRQRNGAVELSVRDTGIGIPEEEQGRVFERFHRIANTRARTHEGTGIGLALVQELVKLHGGSLRVSSVPGQGSTFVLSIPLGTAHLPSESIGATRTLSSTSLGPDAYLDEARRWLGTRTDSLVQQPSLSRSAARNEESPVASEPRRDVIVVADDNADMRDYLAHLLRDQYAVHTVADGAQALKAAQELRPRLVLADIMMPVLDGFGLLQAIRDDERLKSTPVILLSARAGEESRVEGLHAGADDYLVKPFTARELIARVAAHVRMANLRQQAGEREVRLRAEAEQERHRLQELLTQAPAAIGLMSGPEHRWIFVNDDYVRLTGRNSPADFLGKTMTESLPEMETQVFVALLDGVYRTGEPYVGREMKAILNRSAKGLPDESYWDFVYQPVRDGAGKVDGILVHGVEVTDKIAARKAIEDSAERLRLAQAAGHIGTWEWDPVSKTSSLSAELHTMFGIDPADRNIGQTWLSRVHPEDLAYVGQKMEEGHRGGEMEFEYRYQHPARGLIWLYCKGRRLPGETRMLGIVQDITERKFAAAALEESEKKFREFAESATIALHWVGPDGIIMWANQAELDMLGYSAEEYVGRHIAEFHVDAPVIDDILTRLCRGERLRECEARLRSKNGSIRHVLIDSSVLFENGKFVHTRCFTRDITARKLADQALRESEQRLRVVTDATPVMIWMSGVDKLCYYFNKSWLDFVGRTLEQELGQGWTENVHPDDLEGCLQTYIKCFDLRQPFETQYRMRHHSGEYRWILDHGVPRFRADGTFEGYVGGCLDIHEQKAAAEKIRYANEALRESEERFRALVSASSDVVYRMSPDWTEMRRLDGQGFIANTEEPTKDWVERYIYPDDQAAVWASIQRARESKGVFELEHRVRRADGTLGWTLSRAVPLLDAKGEIVEWFGAAADVTVRKQAEESLRQSEQWLSGQKQAFQSAIDGAPLSDSLAILIQTACKQYHGGVRCAFYIADTAYQELHHVVGMPGDYAQCVDGFKIGAESLACGLAVHTGEPRITPDVREDPLWQPWLWLAEKYDYRGCWSFPVKTSAGKVVGTFALYFKDPRPSSPRDLELAAVLTNAAAIIISRHQEAEERGRAERSLRENEERLRLAQQAAGIGAFELNLQTNVNRWTPELEAIYGLAPGTFPGTQEAWERLLHPEDRPAVLREAQAAFNTGVPVQAEWRVLWPDGSIHWVLGRWQVFHDSLGRPTRMAGINIDLTERKAAEEARRRLAAIVESSNDAIVGKDLNGIITSWNRQAERLFGYREEEMIGRSILTIIPPELHRDEDMILNKIRSGQKIEHFETVRITKSGERIELSLSISPVRDGRGNIVGAAKIARDIRQSKKVERALRTTEKLAAAGRLAATVAHEINNPLEAVNNLVFLARRDADNADKVTEYLRLAERELDRVAHIARQTLGFYRDTSAPIRFGVVKMIDDLLFLYEKRFKSRNIRIIKQYKDNREITALAGEIRQAISNLLSNALDAMPSGGTLVIRVSEARTRNNPLQNGLRITILDTGSGIPSPVRKSLFEPFFTTKADVGTGLGLWITRNIVEKHRGNIRFLSTTAPQRHGTAFSIFLPFHDKDREATRAQTSGPSVNATKTLGAV